MPFNPSRQDAVRQVKSAADIVDVVGECVTLKKSGVNFKGLCPFHQEKTPSFIVHPERQFFHCFGCGESGDVLAFVMKYHNLSFPDALTQLAERYHVALPQKKISPHEQRQMEKRELLFAANEQAAAFYHELLLDSEKGAKAREYLDSRGIPGEVLDTYGIGFAPPPGKAGWNALEKHLAQQGIQRDIAVAAGLVVQKDSGTTYDRFRNRIVCPIYDLHGRITGFGGRILEGDGPKYLNTAESDIFQKGSLLFGLFQNRGALRSTRRAILVEGNFDMLALVAHKMENVVAPLGTAVTRSQLRLLKPMVEEVVLLFDGDEAGVKAAQRAVPLFLSEEIPARVARLPSGEDPDSHVREYGVSSLQKYIEQADPLAEFVFAGLVDQHGLDLQGKTQIVRDLQEIIRECATDLQQSLFISHFSRRLGVSESTLKEGLDIHAKRQSLQQNLTGQSDPHTLARLPLKKKQILQFLILSPGYLENFHKAGVRHLLSDAGCHAVLGYLDELAAFSRVSSPEDILSLMPDGDEKQFAARTFLEAAALLPPDTETADRMADEMCSWIAAQCERADGKKLQEEIVAAQAAGDMERLVGLLEKKKNRCQVMENRIQGENVQS